ncbi:MAG: TRAP transporter substrate-binding protein [Dehalococcoidia bacterium]
MRKILLIAVLALALIAVPLFAGCAPVKEETTPAETTPAETIELTYSNFFPPTHANAILGQSWCDEITERTNGQVEFTYYPGGSLTAGPEVYDGVVEGISDVGMTVLAYTAGRFPLTQVVDLPLKYPSGWVATQAASDFYNEFTPEEFSDTHPLYFHAHGPGVLFTVEKPVRKLEEIQGMQIRGTSMGAKVVKALGAEAYAAGQGEAYELMSKKVVDGSYTPREVLKGWNQAEVVKYVTDCREVGYTANMIVTMNNDKWASLPQDVKDVFTEVSEEWVPKHGKVWSGYDKMGIDYFKSLGEGREVIDLSADETARWVDAVNPLIDNYIDETSAEGLPGQEAVDYVEERIGYYSDQAPTADECLTYLEEVLAQAE